MAAHGVRFVFTLCGGHISPLLPGAKAAGMATTSRAYRLRAGLSGLWRLRLASLGSEGIEEALATAKSAAATGRPVLVNAWIGRTDFHKGSLSV